MAAQARGGLSVPTGLAELPCERISRLGSPVETALKTAAVIGREFRFDVLRQRDHLLSPIPNRDIKNQDVRKQEGLRLSLEKMCIVYISRAEQNRSLGIPTTKKIVYREREKRMNGPHVHSQKHQLT